MSPDSLRDQFLAIARGQVEQLPYALDAEASELLDARIERGVATMRDEGRTSDEDIALAERHLRTMLRDAGGRTVLPLGGEPLVLADGLETVLAIGGWWPFS